MPRWAAVREGYEKMWSTAAIRPEKRAAVDAIVSKIRAHEDVFRQVEEDTGVPWDFVGALLSRESNLNMNTYLGNGQSLSRKTTIVPVGRGPFASFREGAKDALEYEMSHNTDLRPPDNQWTPAFACYFAEAFNGFGYMGRINSPYVWSWTNHEQPGKFVADHVFDRNFHDPQCGVAAILLATGEHQMATPASVTATAPAATVPLSPKAPGLKIDFSKLGDVHESVGKLIETMDTVLPIASTFVPQLRILVTLKPAIHALHDLAGDVAAAKGDPAKILAAVQDHFSDIVSLAHQLEAIVPHSAQK